MVSTSTLHILNFWAGAGSHVIWKRVQRLKWTMRLRAIYRSPRISREGRL